MTRKSPFTNNFATVFFAPLVLLGCLGTPDHREYPEAWAELPENIKCPDLGGTYKDKGRTYMGVKYAPSIYLILLGGKVRQMDEVEFVKITQNNNEVVLQAYSDTSLVKERIFSYRQQACSGGFLKIDVPGSEEFVNQEGVLGYGWEAHRLAKTKHGELIVRLDTGSAGLVLLIPAGSADRIWAIFPPINR
jgi:hypothetical protein